MYIIKLISDTVDHVTLSMLPWLEIRSFPNRRLLLTVSETGSKTTA